MRSGDRHGFGTQGAVTPVTAEVYRHQLKPVITRGAETMNIVFQSRMREMPA